jgi:hypothetical protein
MVSSGGEIRQPYPIGDLEYGQIVQATQTLPVKLTTVLWDDTYQLTVSSTAVGLGAIIAGRNSAFITVEGAAVRYRPDNIAPTSTVGHPLEAGAILELESVEELQYIKFIRRDGVDSTLTVSVGSRS